MSKRGIFFGAAVVFGVVVLCLLFGCVAPAGYDADTTPGHDGEEYVGGEWIVPSPESPAFAEATAGGRVLSLTAAEEIRRSPEVRRSMRAYLRAHPRCEWCGRLRTEASPGQGGVEVHHIVPVHCAPELAADQNNMATLCERDHARLGHPGGFKTFVPNLREILDRVNIQECPEADLGPSTLDLRPAEGQR